MKRIMRFAFASLMIASPSYGATTPVELGFETSEPIAVNADSFSADLQGETGTYSGNVLVVQGAIRLRADEITVEAPGGQASHMEARGDIVVESPSGTATGELAVYDITTQIIRLTGNVVLTNNANVMRGDALEVRIADGRATLSGGTTGQGQDQRRVQGLFVPAENENN
jgi:lipopolysaccharide export system protein LptA